MAETTPVGPVERAVVLARTSRSQIAAPHPTAMSTVVPARPSGCLPRPDATPSRAAVSAQPTPLAAGVSPEALPLRWHPPLATAIDRALGPARDSYAVVVKRLDDGCGAMLNAERVFYAASLFKLEILFELFYQHVLGSVRFDEELELTPKYEEYALGELRWPVGSSVPIGELAEKMITHSDNVAAMLLHDRLSNDAINIRMRELGLRQTKVTNDLPTTAEDMALLLEAIARGRMVGPVGRAGMLELLRAQRVKDRIPAGLPRGVPVGHKTGNWDQACHDAGIVFASTGAYVLVVLSEEAACAKRVAGLSAAVYEVLAGDPPAARSAAPR
jgi:beta-lactamase class A